jgi:AcrR family transcriptional regulator
VDAAIRVFAEKGFVETSITDVAEEAEVAVTAVYYHFSGKDELFDAAMRHVLGQISETVSQARPDGTGLEVDALGRAIDAVWDWVDQHPAEAMLAYVHLPGATRQMNVLRREFDDLHVQRAFDYVATVGNGSNKTGAARHASATLAVRTLVDVLMAVHQMRMSQGTLARQSPEALRKAVRDVSSRIITVG